MVCLYRRQYRQCFSHGHDESASGLNFQARAPGQRRSCDTRYPHRARQMRTAGRPRGKPGHVWNMNVNLPTRRHVRAGRTRVRRPHPSAASAKHARSLAWASPKNKSASRLTAWASRPLHRGAPEDSSLTPLKQRVLAWPSVPRSYPRLVSSALNALMLPGFSPA